MATNTTHYGLEKPAQTDVYNIDVFNDNSDKLDAALFDKSDNTNLAPIETTSTASRAYAVGELFVYDGVLRRAIAAIASGATITPDTNCVTTNVDGIVQGLMPVHFSVAYGGVSKSVTFNNSLNHYRVLVTGNPTHTDENGLYLIVGTDAIATIIDATSLVVTLSGATITVKYNANAGTVNCTLI